MYKFNNETNKIEHYKLQDSKPQVGHMMELKWGLPNTMIHRVHEFSENFINANNHRNESEIFYFSDETNILNTPFVNQTEFTGN